MESSKPLQSTPKHVFLAYCKDYAYNRPRKTPLADTTISRYERGLSLVEKILGHSLTNVTNEDQMLFMEKIMEYSQGTRRVSTQIFQRYIAWGIRNEILNCDNLIVGHEEEIIGENSPTSFHLISEKEARDFLRHLPTPEDHMIFGSIYYGGLTAPEVASLTVDDVLDEGLFLYRRVRKRNEYVPLPKGLMPYFHAHIKSIKGPKLFEFENGDYAQRFIASRYRSITVSTGRLLGTTFGDFRKSSIQHFFEKSNDLQLTKQFAGVSTKKRGWLNSLKGIRESQIADIIRAGRRYDAKRVVESVSR